MATLTLTCVLLSFFLLIGNVRGNDICSENPCRNNKAYISFSETGSCYCFHDIGATWAEAKSICQMEGADLATIENQMEADIIVGLFPSDLVNVESASVARVGLRQMNYRNWQWNDGSKLTSKFANWPPGEPNNDRVNLCAALGKNGKLDDIRCNNEVAFICKSKI